MNQERQYHVNDKGEPGICRTVKGKCPFGAKNHYPTANAAREAYEKSQPTLLSSRPVLSPGELFNESKTTSDPRIWNEIIQKGSSRTLANLARNPKIDSDYLIKIHDRAVEKEEYGVLIHCVSNSKYPIGKLTEEDFSHLSEQWSAGGIFTRIARSDDLGDEQISSLVKRAKQYVPFALRNPNNKVSKEKFNEIAHSDNFLKNSARNDPRYENVENFPEMPLSELKKELYWTKNPKIVEKIFELVKDSEDKSRKLQIYETLVMKAESSPEILKHISKDPDSSDYVLGYASFNQKTDKESLDSIAARNPYLNSQVKVRRMNDSNPEFIKNLYSTNPGNYSIGNSQKRQVYFDPDKVKDAGWGKDEIDAVVRRVGGNFLFQSDYNPTTGIYSGYID